MGINVYPKKVGDVKIVLEIFRERFIIIIIRQPLCPVVGRRPQHVVSK